MADTAPTWLVPGAAVVLYTSGNAVGGRQVKTTTIKEVNEKSFTVEDPHEPRFSVAGQRVEYDSKWSLTRYVVPADSDTARKELADARTRLQISRARSAVDEWQKYPTRANRLAAIDLLQAVENEEELRQSPMMF